MRLTSIWKKKQYKERQRNTKENQETNILEDDDTTHFQQGENYQNRNELAAENCKDFKTTGNQK